MQNQTKSDERVFQMADWAGVKEALNSRYVTDFGMNLLAGADGFAASVDVSGKKEVILIFNDDPFISISGIIGNVSDYNINDLLAKMDLFGLRIAADNLVLSHWTVLETIDVPELVYPIELMAKRLASLR